MTQKVHDPYASLRNCNYRYVLACHFVTIVAAQMQSTALGWLLYNRTHSAAILGLAGFTLFMPVLILALPVGYLVDVKNRKMIMVWGVGILTVAAAMLAFFTALDIPLSLFFLMLVVSGIGNALLSTARPVIMRDTLPTHHAENGVNWSSLVRRIASILGPLLAGLFIGWRGTATDAFAFSALLYSVSIAITGAIAVPLRKHVVREPISWAAVTEGARYIATTPLILSATLLDLFASLLSGVSGILPIFAKDILHVGAIGLGLLRSGVPIGSGVMTLILTHRPPLERAGIVLLAAVAAYGLATIVFGVSTSPLLSFVALLLTGAFDAISVTVRATIMQVFVPDRYRGRVYGVNMIFIYSSNELGDFESGILASYVGAPMSAILGGFGAVFIALFFGWKWKELRSLKRMELVSQL